MDQYFGSFLLFLLLCIFNEGIIKGNLERIKQEDIIRNKNLYSLGK
jgi:hypothetical protein